MLLLKFFSKLLLVETLGVCTDCAFGKRNEEEREHGASTELSGMRLCCNGVSMARVVRDYGADPREL